MNNKDVRWKQRYQNFSRAYYQLEEAYKRAADLSQLEKEGLIQRFEYTFELAWKTMKDYLEANDEIAEFARDVIKKAFKFGVIDNGDIWMDMLEKRNLMAHTYDEERFNLAVTKITEYYFIEIKNLFDYFGEKK